MELRLALLLLPFALGGCSGRGNDVEAHSRSTVRESPVSVAEAKSFVGFDRNLYPGDNRLAALHEHFAFSGFWLNNPPGEQRNNWSGHRTQLRAAGFGFLVLWNGRMDAEIKRSRIAAAQLGQRDASEAMDAARREGFPGGTIIFLDQEEGGRLLPEQAAYFFGFTEAIAAGPYRAGAYLSGEASDDGKGPDGKGLTITTAQDVRETIAARKLHPVALWVAQDACPPAPGCTVAPAAVSRLRPADSGTLDAIAWQYAQTPRRPEQTRSCAATYAKDGSCYAGVTPDVFVDLSVASSPDPSHGR